MRELNYKNLNSNKMKNLKINLCLLTLIYSIQFAQAQSLSMLDVSDPETEVPSLQLDAGDSGSAILSSKEVWQADLSVEMTQRNSGYQIYTIDVTCENDDDCRSPKLIFTLPRQSRVSAIRFDSGFEQTAYSIMGSASQRTAVDTRAIDGYLVVDLPNLPIGSTQVRISVELGEKDSIPLDGASVMVYSNTPELNKENNFFYLPLEI